MEPTQTPHTPDVPKLLTVREAAKLAGRHENTLYRLIRAAQASGDDLAKAIVDLPGHHLLIRRQAFERWLDATE